LADDLRSRVERGFDDLSATGRRVALVLLDEHDRLGFHSAAGIARMAGTTDATVIRTIQQLGYRGIIELKASVAQRLAPPTPTQRLDASLVAGTERGGPVLDLLDSQFRALTRLNEPTVRASISRAVDTISTARRVVVNARGVSVGIADYAAAQFVRIGIDSRTLGSAAGLTGDDLLAIGADDALIAISSGPQPRWHPAMYERCAEVSARIVLITDTDPTPVADAVVIRAGRGDPAGTATHVATIATIEAIVLGLASRDPSQARATLDELNRHRHRLTH
jgi:DNA-binding MurR/RpiR family transcriptional regulator